MNCDIESFRGMLAWCFGATYSSGMRQATVILDPRTVLKITRRKYKRRSVKQNKLVDASETMLLTYGRPGYKERLVIKKAKKLGHSFPIYRTREFK